MAYGNTSPVINGSGKRALGSWIENFVDHTANLESSPVFRKWAAISALAATVEQKVWITTSSPLYPHLYVVLVGNAGIGKSRSISAALKLIRELPDPHIAPTSVTMASLVDQLAEAKRTIIDMVNHGGTFEYNSLFLAPDELSAFMHEYSHELIAGLTVFYDVEPYGQARRTTGLKIKIPRPQINILTGTTPSQLLKMIPEYAWEQGFTSRIMLVYSTEKPLIDVFNIPKTAAPDALLHDLRIINDLTGEFKWDADWARAMHNWKLTGLKPLPDHPKLRFYCERRFSHLIKLSMISCIDRTNKLLLTKDDFNRGMGWMLEAEGMMPEIFSATSGSADSKSMDEIYHFVAKVGEKGMPEHKVMDFGRRHFDYPNMTQSYINLMINSGLLEASNPDARTGLRVFRAIPKVILGLQ